MAAASSSIIAVMLAVGGGRRVASQSPAGRSTYHCYYNTVLQCDSGPGSSIPAELRVYSPRNSTVLADNTVVFVYARVHVPPGGTALLDAIHVYPFPGDPAEDSYDDHLPEIPPYIFGLGVVRSVRDVTAVDNNKRITLEVAERVREERRGFTFEARFECASPRWARVPLPALQSVAQVVGIFSGVRHDGMLIADVESITFNALPPATAADGAGPPPATPPTKKRKYMPYVAPPDGSSSSPRASTSASASSSASSETGTSRADPVSSARSAAGANGESGLVAADGSAEDVEHNDEPAPPAQPSTKAAGKRKATR
ncbi:hypothetical protein PsYK624_062880 [Phanerochaete sordida]|uniref:Uncharacterized protein n=1 Tax=Phanerochaete sordida TaxID=48140 RepID=A0A9P3LDP8_9APHY|nr:hypothetical protein PsYK624_062870 [Phanerochaete sordida]GJE90162.1 hypothetical protein PsYK624_062880 [Phanerochaete sordida]